MSKFVDENIKVLESDKAFDILKKFINYMIEHYDHHSEYEMVESLRYLKSQSDTNEIFYTNEQKNKIFALYKQEHSQNTLQEILKK